MFENAIGLKQKYRNGERIIGVSMAPNTPPDRFDQIMDQDDYDFVSIDSQHTPLSEERVAAFCDMAAERDVFVQFRIKHTRNAYLIGNYLDLGPCGIEIPQTELEETVDDALHYFYYPPAGGRSFGGGHRRGAEGKETEEYADWWPTDLSMSIKAHPQHWLKSVDDTIAYLCRSLEGTGVAVCHRNRTPDTREKYADMGVTVFLESA